MRKGFFFNTARAAAFASLGFWAGALPVQVATAGPPQSGPGSAVTPQGDVQTGVPGFLTEFWDLAWGAEFVLDQSGMGLEPTTVPGTLGVTAYDQYQPIGEGLYDEVLRLQVPGPWNDELPQGGSAVFDLYVTAGTFHGPDGYSTPTWGLVQHIEIDGDDSQPLIVEGFTPLGTADDLAIAVAGATDIVGTLMQWSALTADGPPPFTPDPCLCGQIYDNDVSACVATAIACDLACTSLALIGLAVCLGAGPFVAPCVLLVLAAHALCIGGCLAEHHACELRAANHRLRCERSCDEDEDL